MNYKYEQNMSEVQLNRTNAKVTMQVFIFSKFSVEFGTLFANNTG